MAENLDLPTHSAFHVMIFHYNSSLVMPHKSQLSSIRTGLENWKSIWNRRSLNDDERFFDVLIATLEHKNAAGQRYQHEHIPADEPSMWKRSGFWRYAPEYWLLANLSLDRIESSPFSHNSMIDMGSRKYDDMSMSRLKEVISNFQSARLRHSLY